MITKKEFDEIKAQYEGVKKTKNRYESDDLSFILAIHHLSGLIKKYGFDKGEAETLLKGYYDKLHKLFVDSTNELREKRIAFVKAQSEYNGQEEEKEKKRNEALVAKADAKIKKAVAALVALGMSEEEAKEIVKNKG